jgi:cell division protein FtsZ
MARERGILTVGVVTKPFDFEGPKRRKSAEQGIEELQQFVDTLIIIPNQNLFRLANERTTFQEAFKMADNVLYMGVRGVTDLMVNPGMVNLDFADIRTVMAEMGKAMMGTGEAEGEDRARRAAESAISNPLLEDISMRGARGVLINITGGYDMTLFEVDGAANRIREEVDEDANIIFGTSVDESMNGRVRVSVVATGIDAAQFREAEKPKLVAVGGGAAQPVNAVANQAIGAAPTGPGLPFMRRAAQAAPALRPAIVDTAPAPEPEVAPSPAPVAEAPVMLAPAPAFQPEAPQLRVPVTEAVEPQPASAEPRPSGLRGLFGKVTGMGGMMKRNLPPQAEPQAYVQEPPQAPRPEPKPAPAPRLDAGRPTQQDEMSLEIPAFLRRQRS